MSSNNPHGSHAVVEPVVEHVVEPVVKSKETSCRDHHQNLIPTITIQESTKEGDDIVYTDGFLSDQHMRRRNPNHNPSSWRSCRAGGEGCIIHGSERNWMGLIFVDGYGCPCRIHQSKCPPPWGNEY